MALNDLASTGFTDAPALQRVRELLLAEPANFAAAEQVAANVFDPALQDRVRRLIELGRSLRDGRTVSDPLLSRLLTLVPSRWRATAAAILAAVVAAAYFWSGPARDPHAPERAAVPFPLPVPPFESDGRGGTVTFQHGSLAGLTAIPAPPGFRLDEPFDRWDRSGRFRSAWAAPYGDDYFVDGGLLYDADGLYLRARVGDPWPLRNQSPPKAGPNAGWEGGSLQLRLATAGAVEGDQPSKTFYHLTIWYHALTKQPYLQVAQGRNLELNPTQESVVSRPDRPDQFGAVYTPAPNGYDAAARIPWAVIGLSRPPEIGSKLGVCWEVCWGDRSGQRHLGKLTEFFRPERLRDLLDRGVATEGVPGKLSYQHPAIWGTTTFAPAVPPNENAGVSKP